MKKVIYILGLLSIFSIVMCGILFIELTNTQKALSKITNDSESSNDNIEVFNNTNDLENGSIEFLLYEKDTTISDQILHIENLQSQIEHIEKLLIEQQQKTDYYKNESEQLENHQRLIDNMLPSYNKWNLYVERYQKTSRGSYDRENGQLSSSPIRMRVTTYTEYECDKEPDHPYFGITASGNRVVEWFTAAAGPELPFGTRIYIPHFKNEENNGIFVVEDRGGAIKYNCIDVYIKDQQRVDLFGLQYLDVYILD